MFRAFRSTRRKTSHFAMALALAGGAAFGTAAVAPAAFAQDYSEGFVETYSPVAALTQGDAPDLEGARARISAVEAAVQTADDRMAAGNLILIVGNGLNDSALQRRGLEMMLASGKVPAEQVAQFNYYVGSIAYNMDDFAASRAAINAALAAGYSDDDNDPLNDPEYIIIQSYLAEDASAQGVAYLLQLADERMAAGQTVPERWLLRGLQETYDMELTEQSVDVSEALLANHPTERNWLNSLQVVNALYEFDEDTRVDLYRLMRETNALSQRQEYIRLIEDLDPRIMGNEVIAIVEEGQAAGIFEAGDGYASEVLTVARPRAEADRNGLAGIVREGENGDAVDAMGTGDVLYSVQDYARAETFYALAAERGFDVNAATIRVGMSQAMQGKYDEASATFANVGGVNAPIARMWSIWTAQQAEAAPAEAAVAGEAM